MSAVERHAYMDNQKSSQMNEQILKERRIQRQYFQEQETAGRLPVHTPTPPPVSRSALETVGVPDFIHKIKDDPEAAMGLCISKAMLKSIPGYLTRDGPRMASQMKRDYVYDAEEVEYMRSLGHLDKTHNRKRDEFVLYVEAAARAVLLTKGAAAQVGKA
ncbi:MAG: hypothetical protein WDW38_004609 [Sanguina aurantia]